jgi:gamma-glutamyl hercynylcysteine S-oxide synthase
VIVRAELTRALNSARNFTKRIAYGVSEAALHEQFDPLFSPIGWHLGHIAWQEEVWIGRRTAGRAPIEPRFDALFDSFTSVKSDRGSLLPEAQMLWRYLARVREQTLECLEHANLDQPDELLHQGYVFRFIANHERQHAEIIGIVRLLGALYLEDAPVAHGASSAVDQHVGFLKFAGGAFPMGTDTDPDAWDNERPARSVVVEPFELAARPVTCGEWLEFMAAGGYDDARLWSAEGNLFRTQHVLRAPLHWSRDRQGDVVMRTLAGVSPVDARASVGHISWHEAQAFARFAGARLPSEAEWEYAASWDPSRSCKRRWPWGDRPGSVWEWVADAFGPYPGFRPQAYAGYSQPWFDGRHRVLRGGCFLSQREIARSTFRNWYLPEMRQVPSGLRLARDRTEP